MGPTSVLLCLLAQDAPVHTGLNVHTGTFELEFELVCECMEIEEAGKVYDLDEYLGDWRFIASGTRAATWRDTWAEVEAGQPRVIERVFERLEGSYVLGLESGSLAAEEQVMPLTSPLVGRRLRGEREGDAWTFAYMDEDPPAAEWLEGLTVTRGLAGLLPEADGADDWRLDQHAAAGWLAPFGDPRFEPHPAEGSYPELVLLLAWTVDPVRHAPLEDLQVDAALTSVEDTARYELELNGVVDLWSRALHLADQLDIDDDMLEWVDAAQVTWSWEGSGGLEGFEQVTTPLEAKFDVTLGALLEIEVRDMVIRLWFDGSVEQFQTWR